MQILVLSLSCALTYSHTHTHTHTHMHTHILSHTHTHTHTLTYSHTHTLTYSHTHTHTHTHMHTHTHTCTAETKHNMEEGSGGGEEDDGVISLKVLYAPDNNLTRSIMTKANRTFATAEYIRDWAEQVADCSDHFLKNYPPDSPRVERLRQVWYRALHHLFHMSCMLFFMDYIIETLHCFAPQTIDFLLYNDSASGVWEYLQNAGEIQNVTITNASLFRVSELLNPNSSDNIWDILERTRDTANVSGPIPFCGY